jgi:dTDP-4-amino-4,6-dideoxygalactose transaminase
MVGNFFVHPTADVSSKSILADRRRDRKAAVKQLNSTSIFYPVPANKQVHLVEMGLVDVLLPVAEKLAMEVISLPVHPQLSQADLETIVAEVNKL